MANGYYAMGYGTEMDGCGRFMKYSLFVSNFIIFIGGCTVAGLAIWALVDRVPFITELLENNLLTGAVYVLLVGGIIVAFISFFGCLGASKEVKCMLLTYFLIIFLLFVMMLIGGILGYVFRSKVLGSLEQEMKTSMTHYDRIKYREAWDATQRTLHCCGVKSWRDWNSVGINLPKSCCREIQPGQYFNCNATPDSPNVSNTYTKGCLNGTELYIQRHASIIGAAGITVACLMLFGMIFSCALFRMIE